MKVSHGACFDNQAALSSCMSHAAMFACSSGPFPRPACPEHPLPPTAGIAGGVDKRYSLAGLQGIYDDAMLLASTGGWGCSLLCRADVTLMSGNDQWTGCCQTQYALYHVVCDMRCSQQRRHITLVPRCCLCTRPDFQVVTLSSQIGRLAYELAQVSGNNAAGLDKSLDYHSLDSLW